MICIEDKFRRVRKKPVYLESFAYRDHTAVDPRVSDRVVQQFRATCTSDLWIIKSHHISFVISINGVSDD